MVIYLAVLGSLLLAWLAITIIWPRPGVVQTLPTIFLSISIGTFIYLYGPWFFLTIYLKYLFAVVMVVLFVIYALRRGEQPPRHGNRRKATLNIIFGSLMLVFVVLYFTGTNGRPYGIVDLPLPFKQGTYLVLQGGNGLPTNLFHYRLRKAAEAMDIVKLNKFGNRAEAIYTDNLHKYAIYGDTIYSPCDGMVTSTEDSNPDNKPGIIRRGPRNTNFVMIEAPKYYLLMAHFIPGSLMVRDGDKISKGQPVALAGNSGYSLEPHLHIQVMTKDDPTLPWYAMQQLEMRFAGRQYFLFQTIQAEPF